MTDDELLEAMCDAYESEAQEVASTIGMCAALAVALPEILERAARVADDEVDGTELGVDGLLMSRKIAAAIRKLGE